MVTLHSFFGITSIDTQYYFVLIIPRSKVVKLDDVILSPMNIVTQMGINDEKKRRPTHNQSMLFSSGTNRRLIEEEMKDVMYGQCMTRIIHGIIARRRDYPTSRILLQQVDLQISIQERAPKYKISSSYNHPICQERTCIYITMTHFRRCIQSKFLG